MSIKSNYGTSLVLTDKTLNDRINVFRSEAGDSIRRDIPPTRMLLNRLSVILFSNLSYDIEKKYGIKDVSHNTIFGLTRNNEKRYAVEVKSKVDQIHETYDYTNIVFTQPINVNGTRKYFTIPEDSMYNALGQDILSFLSQDRFNFPSNPAILSIIKSMVINYYKDLYQNVVSPMYLRLMEGIEIKDREFRNS